MVRTKSDLCTTLCNTANICTGSWKRLRRFQFPVPVQFFPPLNQLPRSLRTSVTTDSGFFCLTAQSGETWEKSVPSYVPSHSLFFWDDYGEKKRSRILLTLNNPKHTFLEKLTSYFEQATCWFLAMLLCCSWFLIKSSFHRESESACHRNGNSYRWTCNNFLFSSIWFTQANMKGYLWDLGCSS